jgi:hypothetical protein
MGGHTYYEDLFVIAFFLQWGGVGEITLQFAGDTTFYLCSCGTDGWMGLGIQNHGGGMDMDTLPFIALIFNKTSSKIWTF